jgi:hypothetical protein
MTDVQGAKTDTAWDGSAADPSEIAILKRLAAPGAGNVAAGAVVALTTPSGTLSSGDNALAVTSAVRHIWIENNSGSAIGYAMDAVASAGSRQIPAGSARILDEPCATAIHIFVGGSTPYNGTVGSNVVVLAWA